MSENICKHKVKKSVIQIIYSKRYKFQNEHTYFSDRDRFFDYKRGLTIKYQKCSKCGKKVEMKDSYYSVYRLILLAG